MVHAELFWLSVLFWHATTSCLAPRCIMIVKQLLDQSYIIWWLLLKSSKSLVLQVLSLSKLVYNSAIPEIDLVTIGYSWNVRQLIQTYKPLHWNTFLLHSDAISTSFIKLLCTCRSSESLSNFYCAVHVLIDQRHSVELSGEQRSHSSSQVCFWSYLVQKGHA